jgi:hypothetical protein
LFSFLAEKKQEAEKRERGRKGRIGMHFAHNLFKKNIFIVN